MKWLTVREAADLAGVSRRQMLRRLEACDEQCGGRLLRWRGRPGGVREVNPKVLRQLLTADPVERERELSEVHERIDVLDDRTAAIRGQLVTHRKKLDALKATVSAHQELLTAWSDG